MVTRLKPSSLALLLFLAAFSVQLRAQLSSWGHGNEQIVKGVFAQYGDQTVFFEWRRKIKDDYPKSTLMMLRTDTTNIRGAFSIDERSFKPSIQIPSLMQVLYLMKGGPGPDDFDPTDDGIKVKWMELPIEDEVTGSYSDFWRLVPGKGFVRDSSSGFQIMDIANMGHMRDTLKASETRYHPSGAKWIETSWSPRPDSLGWKRLTETAFYEEGAKSMERSKVWKGAVDTVRIKGWHPSGEPAFEQVMINGKLEGAFARWYPNGNKIVDGTYRQGMRVGTWKEYYPDGTPASEWKYDAALPDGKGYSARELVSAWDVTGSRTAIAGKGTRTFTYFNADGCSVKATEEYKGGERDGDVALEEDCSGTSDFPSVEYAYVKAYRQGGEHLNWDVDYDQSWHFHHLKGVNRPDFFVAGLMHPQFRGEGKTLTKGQAALLVKALNGEGSFEQIQGGSKADASALFIFYDGDHLPVAYCATNMGVQRVVSHPVLSIQEPPQNAILSPEGYKALAKLCMELWPGEDGLCDPMGFLPAEQERK